MSETMTLEGLRNVLREEFMIRDAADVEACIDAAIRERDELVSALAQERSARTYAENLLEDRDAELAALRKRIARDYLDAKRYRWLRRNLTVTRNRTCPSHISLDDILWEGEEVDDREFINAAIDSERGTEEDDDDL